MHPDIISCGPDFWNIRGSFKLAGLIDLGTQCSLVRLSDGRFVILDSYTLSEAVLAELDEITGGREAVAAVINLHPFHTLHSEAMHRTFPKATHYATARHKTLYPDLDWAPRTSEELVGSTDFAPDLAFSIPDGVMLVPANDKIHCGSILAYHRPSGTIHVDDTFNLRKGKLSVHPTLRFALERRAGAAAAFRDWGARLAADWAEATTLCAAHNGVLGAADLGTGTLREAIAGAMAASEKTLARHTRKYG